MDIYQAAIQALATGKHMKRRAWRIASVGVEEVAVYVGDEAPKSSVIFSSVGGRWKPVEEDVLADDWELVEAQADTEPRRKEPEKRYIPTTDKTSKMRMFTLALALFSLAVSLAVLLLK